MELSARLAAAIEQIPGAVAISVLGLDGVAVETVAGAKPLVGTSQATLPGEETLGPWELELADLMLNARRAARSLNWGPLRHVTLEARDLLFLLQPLDADYVLLLALDRAANATRARFELQQLAAALAAAPDSAE